MRAGCLLLMFSVILLTSWENKTGFRKVQVRDNICSFELPDYWKLNKNYPRYSDYTLKYSLQFIDKKSMSECTVVVHDSLRLLDNEVNEELIKFHKKDLDTQFGASSLRYTEAAMRKINGRDVAIIRYNFTLYKKDHEGAELFFVGPGNQYYGINMISYKAPATEFGEIVERVIRSLRFGF